MLLEWLRNKPINKLGIYRNFIPSALPFHARIEYKTSPDPYSPKKRQQVSALESGCNPPPNPKGEPCGGTNV